MPDPSSFKTPVSGNVQQITPDEVHAWRISLNTPLEVVKKHENLLSEDEKERAGKFTRKEDKYQYIIRHGALRQILSCYVDINEKHLKFTYGKQGKPFLDGKHNMPGIHFNLSVSGPLALIAVTVSKSIGVDIERIRPGIDHLGIARLYFSADENSDLQKMDESRGLAAFYKMWTIKEACAKALGTGISQYLDKPSMPLEQGTPDDSARRPVIHELRPEKGFAGAIAVMGGIKKISCWNWNA